ncbi:MAG: HAD hydrolase family protein [Candidatus Cloacimonetes bacterium]|nr:HAD hydrolase family protein [Candidatus Cloacimonadota bacterium]
MAIKDYREKDYIIGIDLHGTLLNNNWTIAPESLPELISVLSAIRSKSYIFICSGNDFSFVKEVLPTSVRELIDGYILENGCSFSDGIKEQLLITDHQVDLIKALEEDLKKTALPDLLLYGNRLATVSLFTKNRVVGVSPFNLYAYLKDHLQNHPSYNDIYITHSDVAVDILPAGNSKFSGIAKFSQNNKIIALADSCNDWEFLSQADLSFVPQNVTPHLVEKCRLNDLTLFPLSAFSLQNIDKTIYKSDFCYTSGVIDILKKLSENL